jgi:hypothetical protein
MTDHLFTESLSKKSTSIIEINYINTIRKAKYEKTFSNSITGERFTRNDVQILKYKRNLFIKEFFRKYDSSLDFTMIEIGIDFKITNKESDILFCFENTGVYSLPLSFYLCENNLDYWMVPAIEIKRSKGISNKSAGPIPVG